MNMPPFKHRMPPGKPYRQIPIRECGEPMVHLPKDVLAFADPHPYVAAGAPYGGASPWMLRLSVAESLLKAQKRLSKIRSGWKIKLMDAYRPNSVQAYMVECEFAVQAKAEGLNPAALSKSERERLSPKVFSHWGIPSDDPATPPPHSTGAAFDCTLIDETGREIDMGCPVDENSDLSFPEAFEEASDAAEKKAHACRVLLREVLEAEGLVQHLNEWWHFSRGDQLAVWIEREKNPDAFAIYGRAPL
jgi:D-alanyl-D-alanine dipeptidase